MFTAFIKISSLIINCYEIDKNMMAGGSNSEELEILYPLFQTPQGKDMTKNEPIDNKIVWVLPRGSIGTASKSARRPLCLNFYGKRTSRGVGDRPPAPHDF